MQKPMKPYGRALTDYFNGDLSVKIKIHRDDGENFEVPVSMFFKEPEDFSIIENKAIELCFGKVLDIGAGTGSHSLELQRKGFDVTSIDISPEAVEIMIKRGVKNAQCYDIYKYNDKKFNTLLMLSHGIGIVEDIAGLIEFLNHAYTLTEDNGILVVDSLDVRCTDNPAHLAYHERNKRMGRYFGEIHMQFEYKGIKGVQFSWLHIDPDTLEQELTKTRWFSEIIHKEVSGDYLVKLMKR